MVLSNSIVDNIANYLKKIDYDFSDLSSDKDFSDVIKLTNEFFNLNYPNITNEDKLLIFSNIYSNFISKKSEHQNIIKKEKDDNIKTSIIKEEKEKKEEKMKEIMKQSFNEMNFLQKQIFSKIDIKNINAGNILRERVLNRCNIKKDEKISLLDTLLYDIVYAMDEDIFNQLSSGKPVNFTHYIKFLEMLKGDEKNTTQSAKTSVINQNNTISISVDAVKEIADNSCKVIKVVEEELKV